MTAVRQLTICVLAGLLADPALASESIPVGGRLAIGSTGIACVQTPCPWRGVVEIDDQGRDPLRPRWSGGRLPSLDATPQDAARIESAWNAMDCLLIEGMMADDPGESGSPVIRVDRIIGPCP